MDKSQNNYRVLAFRYFQLNDEAAGRTLFRALLLAEHLELLDQYSDGMVDRLFDLTKTCWSEDRHVFRDTVRQSDYSLPAEVIMPAWDTAKKAWSIYAKNEDSFGRIEGFLIARGGLHGIVRAVGTQLAEWIPRALIFSVIIFYVVSFGHPYYQDWEKKQEALRMEQERNSVPIDASLAGIQLAAAYRACVRIGISKVDTCASYEGKLLQEIGAPLIAQSALEVRSKFWRTCQNHYKDDYCLALINRAFELSLASNKQ